MRSPPHDHYLRLAPAARRHLGRRLVAGDGPPASMGMDPGVRPRRAPDAPPTTRAHNAAGVPPNTPSPVPGDRSPRRRTPPSPAWLARSRSGIRRPPLIRRRPRPRRDSTPFARVLLQTGPARPRQFSATRSARARIEAVSWGRWILSGCHLLVLARVAGRPRVERLRYGSLGRDAAPTCHRWALRSGIAWLVGGSGLSAGRAPPHRALRPRLTCASAQGRTLIFPGMAIGTTAECLQTYPAQ